ncbi:MAG TPA: damage-control phosphatase ARMT1 family protein [Anaerolineales bacterium]|nr:damage-control phosphatase ARMT1 family protein [Anaerolineales bacterium]
MINHSSPALPIPPPLRGADTTFFTYDSVARRLDEIGQRTINENTFPPEVNAKIRALLAGIPLGVLPVLQHEDEPQAREWGEWLAPYRRANWLTAPWFLIEIYFYRKLLDITGYFRAGPLQGFDPFTTQKEQGLRESRKLIRQLCARQAEQPSSPVDNLAFMLQCNLWGNQADLSMWPSGNDSKESKNPGADRQDKYLVDDSQAAARYLLEASPARRVDFLIDNAGLELAADLLLVDYLLEQTPVQEIHLHVKIQPVLVSDVLAQDVYKTLQALADDEDAAIRSLALRVQHALKAERVRLQAHPFWTSPLPGWEMPSDLRAELSAADLVVSKGDAHYRRWLGDRQWDYAAPVEQVLNYVPAPLVAMRVCKADVAVGIPPARQAAARQADPDWLHSGEFAMIQFAQPDHE